MLHFLVYHKFWGHLAIKKDVWCQTFRDKYFSCHKDIKKVEKGCAKVEIEPSCFIKTSDWQVGLLPLQWVPGVLHCIFWHTALSTIPRRNYFSSFIENILCSLSIPVSLHNLMVSLLFSIWKPQNCMLTSLVIQAHCRISSTECFKKVSW